MNSSFKNSSFTFARQNVDYNNTFVQFAFQADSTYIVGQYFRLNPICTVFLGWVDFLFW